MRRLKCLNCNKIHIEAPDFIAKNKHYSNITIENYINGINIDIAADNKTLYRWKNEK